MSAATAAAAAGRHMAKVVAAGVGLGGALVLLGFLGGRARPEVLAAKRMARPRRARRPRVSSEVLAAKRMARPRRARRSRVSSEADDSSEVEHRLASRGGGPGHAQQLEAWSSALALAEQVMGVGFSRQQARLMAEASQAAALQRAEPHEVRAELQRGNVRFWTGRATRLERSAFEQRALISKQFPTTAILGCSDSRVPIELVFDQGLGDMFIIRVAGNCLDAASTASLQYAVHHLKVKLLIVLGHQGCGAVKAAQLPTETLSKEPETLGKLLKGMRQGLDAADSAKMQDVKAADREAVTTNVKAQVETLTRDDGIMAKVGSGELMLLGAVYEMSSGVVDFFHEVAGQEAATEQCTEQKAPSLGVLSRCQGPPESLSNRTDIVDQKVES